MDESSLRSLGRRGGERGGSPRRRCKIKGAVGVTRDGPPNGNHHRTGDQGSPPIAGTTILCATCATKRGAQARATAPCGSS
eukprot:176214-Prymnesium_polylepis.1